MSLEQDLHNLKSVRLTDQERAQMRQRLLAVVDQNAFTKVSFINQLKYKFSMPIVIVALLLALSGGTVAAASTSLPGDTLYPIKTEVNERVAASLKFSSEAKAEHGLKLAEKRLMEAEKLALNGRLNGDLVTKLETRFDHHEERMRALVARLEAEGKTEAAARLSSNLEASLQAHANILSRLQEKTANGESLEKEAMTDLMESVRESMEDAKELRVQHEGQLKPEFKIQAATSNQVMVEQKVTILEEQIAKLQADLGAEASVEASVKLEEAKTLIAQGQVAISEERGEEAFSLFREAHRKTHEASMLLKGHERILKHEIKIGGRK